MPSTYRAIVLKKHNMGQRKARKKKSLGNHVDRNAQFENIAKLKAEFIKNGDPVISIDTKKKELIGNFSRDGKTYTQAQVETSDHDFPSVADGKLIPHGIFDVVRNEGHLNLNTSHDTSEFCCDSIAHWWLNYGRLIYATSSKILILCDGGGSNSSRSNLFKESLKKLAIQLGMDIRIAHYPPHCSKHNPIEHRFFSHVTRACQGVVFHSVAIAKQFMEKTKTNKGLKVTVDILAGVYETGKKCAADFSKNTCISSDEHLPLWNYQAMGAK